jgi:hypothetical protein
LWSVWQALRTTNVTVPEAGAWVWQVGEKKKSPASMAAWLPFYGCGAVVIDRAGEASVGRALTGSAGTRGSGRRRGA